MKSTKRFGSKKRSERKIKSDKPGLSPKAKNRTTRKDNNSTDVRVSPVDIDPGCETRAEDSDPTCTPGEPAITQESVTASYLDAETVDLPAVSKPRLPGRTYVTCDTHTDVQFRVGGFCEKCYEEDSQDRLKRLDATLDDLVLKDVEAIIKRIIDAETPIEVVERFFARILNRFSRPQKTEISGQVKALHLHAPVDFAKRSVT